MRGWAQKVSSCPKGKHKVDAYKEGWAKELSGRGRSNKFFAQ